MPQLSALRPLPARRGRPRAAVRLKDEKKTVVSVARDRVRALKERLGI